MAGKESELTKTTPTDEDLVITRTFDAPRTQVWKAWTEPERLMRWWGGKDWTAPVCRVDLRVGGKYVICMRAPGFKDTWMTGTYREIVEPERIVCTDAFADDKGNQVPASYYDMGEMPDELLITVTFQELEKGKTRFTLRHTGLPAGEDRDMTAVGWNESFDKLAQSLK